LTKVGYSVNLLLWGIFEEPKANYDKSADNFKFNREEAHEK
jgi:hypothetical protein